jgi:homocysteine S-methyltransferase
MGRSEQFLDALKSRVLIGDGAMGTALQHHGIGHDQCFEALNSTNRAVVRGIFESYVAAGADVLETNTFRANRSHLAQFGLAEKVFEFNYRGARLARSVAGRHVFVAGSVGPLGTAGPGSKELTEQKRIEMYVEQMGALAAGGVDLLLLETFTSLSEIRSAIRAAKKAAKGLPVLAQMAFYEGQGSLGGVSIGAAIEEILAEGADGVGVNCGRGFADALAVVEKMAALTDVPISAYPNAGLPELRDGRFVYEQPVSYMAEMAQRMADAGANLIGGCCGTDQRAIAAIAAKIRGRALSPRRSGAAVEATVPATPKSPAVAPADPRKRGFLARLGREPLVVVELDPPRGMLTDKVVEGARLLRTAGAHLVSMAENPLASIRMGNVGMAYVVRRDAGLEPLVHFTGRDRNTLGLHSDLMGAAALGIQHVLAITGDPAGAREGGVTSVYDVNSIGLVKIISALNAGRTIHGVDTGRSTDFTVGVAFNPNFRTMTGQVKKLQQKVEAGAHFALTQLVFDETRIAQVREATDPCGIPVLPGVMPLVSLKNALFVKNEVPGVTVPDEVVARMEAVAPGEAARAVGLDIARGLIRAALRSGAPGIYIVAPFNRADLAAELVAFVKSEYR